MSPLITTREGAIAVLTFNRADKMNSYSVDLHDALIEAIAAADTDPSVRVIVITGAGRAFCAGADLEAGFGGSGLSQGAPIIDGISRDYGGMLVLRLYECDTPVIGAVNGVAVGIGATMLLPMDVKIASSTAKMGFPFSRRGIVFDGAASWFLPRIVGWSQAQKWITTGEIFMSQDALDAGMINELAEPQDVLPRAMEIARDIALNTSPKSVAMNKQLMRASLRNDLDYGGGPMGAHMRESKMLQERFASTDCAEGVASFLQKRAPKFDNNEG